MVIIQFHYDETGGEKEALDLLQHVADTFPQITSLLYLDNQKCNDTIGDQDILVFKGTDHIFELMEDLKFKVGPKSFYQTNTEQAYHLYSVARAFAFAPIENGKLRTESYDYSQDEKNADKTNHTSQLSPLSFPLSWRRKPGK